MDHSPLITVVLGRSCLSYGIIAASVVGVAR